MAAVLSWMTGQDENDAALWKKYSLSQRRCLTMSSPGCCRMFEPEMKTSKHEKRYFSGMKVLPMPRHLDMIFKKTILNFWMALEKTTSQRTVDYESNENIQYTCNPKSGLSSVATLFWTSFHFFWTWTFFGGPYHNSYNSLWDSYWLRVFWTCPPSLLDLALLQGVQRPSLVTHWVSHLLPSLPSSSQFLLFTPFPAFQSRRGSTWFQPGWKYSTWGHSPGFNI